MLRHLEHVLKKRSGQARRDPEHFQRRVLPPGKGGDRLQSLRRGHRAGEETVEKEESLK